MKPIFLHILGFGPYLHAVNIDFEKLNDAGLFLITGTTGSGKTTLLDAMCIALFGKSTGGKRTFSDMRNLACEPQTNTEVTYTFQLGEEEYEFHRSFCYYEKRGSHELGITETNTCKRRTKDGWELLASGAGRNVTKFAEELLSLTAEQFSQVIVLPQGKFMQLLRANSTEKAAILKTLFSCEIWDRITQKFSDRQKTLYAQRQTCETKLNSLLEKHNVQTPEALAAQTELLKTTLQKAEQSLKDAQTEMDTAQKAYTRALRFEQCLKNEKDSTAQLKNAEERLKSAQSAYAQAEKNRAALPDLNREKEELLRRSERLLNEQKTGAEKDALEKDLRRAETEETDILKRIKTDTARRTELRQRIADGEAYTENCDKAKDRLIETAAALAVLETKLSALKTRSEAQTQFNKCCAAEKSAEDDVRKARLTVTAQDQLLTAEEAKRNQNSAAALASALQDGAPCPVCGSVHHPALAKPCAGTLTEEEIDALRKNLEKLRRAQIHAEQVLASAKTQSEMAEAQLNAANESCSAFTETEEALSAAHTAAQESFSSDKMFAEKAPRAHERLESLKKESDALQKAESQSAAALAACRAALEEKRHRFEALQNVRGSALLTEEMIRVKKRLQSVEAEISALDSAFRTAENRLAAAKESVKTAQMQMQAAKEATASLGTAPERSLAESKAALDDVNARIQTLSEQSGRLNADLRSASESLELTRTYAAEAAALDRQYSRAAKLSGYVTGRNNTMRVPLLQYVLGMMLDETVASANQFFAVLSRGRYALQHTYGKTGSGYGGLNIEVLDGMSGASRSVETLSGGEQFLASLSLAFGLSDVVQNYTGAVRLDSIFIDEGFGTLDSDTLDTAMRALENIRQSGRVVGIISHVSELQSRIPTSIRITRTKDGSAAANVIAEE